MQVISDREVFEGGRYASTEEELYEKAIALLDKCEIATQPAGQRIPTSKATPETSPITA